MLTIKIEVTDRAGKVHILDAPTDLNMNIMELCKSAALGVEGTCGGMALCASCHCYVSSDHELKPPSDEEMDMLDQTFYLAKNSRLGCQIRLTEKLDGLQIQLAQQAN